jgi:4-amino-4-deoxy-L-arabinose transferase-like glycosyltransferase
MLGITNECSQRSPSPWSLRVSLLFASVAWGTTLVAVTEILSLLHLFQREALLTAWVSVFLIGGMLYGWLAYRRLGASFSLAEVRIVASNGIATARKWNVSNWTIKPPSRLIVVMVFLIVLQVVTLAMVAYQFAPNTWDSMTYHLGRVVHWQQAQSVQHYATHIERQLQMPPFAEFVIAHLHVMTIGDQFANLVQWFAMVFCLVGVSEIARQFGSGVTQQVIAALLCVSIPMGILQATSTQNDYVVALWLVCFVALGMAAVHNVNQWSYIVGTGLALGLALLAKASAFLYAAPFSILIGLALLYRLRWAALGRGLVITLLLLTVNAGHFTRNTLLYHSPIGSSEGEHNELFSLNVLASNTIRSLAVNIPLQTGIPVLDTTSEFAMGWLRLAHEFTGLDPEDGRNSKPGNVFLRQRSFDEDYSGNPLHAVLIVMTASVGAVWLWNRRQYRIIIYMLALIVAFLLFAGYLKITPWRHRLHLSLFILWCPVIAEALFTTRNRLVLSIPILVALFGFNWTFNNATRPLNAAAAYAQETRTEGYFTKRPDLLPIYQQITRQISVTACSRVGIIMGVDSWDYPFWMLLRENGYQGIIKHIRVMNTSNVYEDTAFQPCAIIAEGTLQEYPGFVMQSFEKFSLYLDPETVPPPDVLPVGVKTSAEVGVLMGTGWYNFESEANVRWMQGRGQIWIYANDETEALLRLNPRVMNVNNSFGATGQLTVTVNGMTSNTLQVTAEETHEIRLDLKSGYNEIVLELAAGDFVPYEVNPDLPDERRLGIAFYPIEIEVVSVQSSHSVRVVGS